MLYILCHGTLRLDHTHTHTQRSTMSFAGELAELRSDFSTWCTQPPSFPVSNRNCRKRSILLRSVLVHKKVYYAFAREEVLLSRSSTGRKTEGERVRKFRCTAAHWTVLCARRLALCPVMEGARVTQTQADLAGGSAAPGPRFFCFLPRNPTAARARERGESHARSPVTEHHAAPGRPRAQACDRCVRHAAGLRRAGAAVVRVAAQTHGM